MTKLEDQLNDDYIGGLLAEKAMALQSKNKERAAAVDDELKRVDYKPAKEDKAEPKAKPKPEPKAKPKPRKSALKVERAIVEPVEEKAVIEPEVADKSDFGDWKP